MSRAGEGDDFDTWAMIRWHGASKRAIGGRPGQKFLKELEQSILDLPNRRLTDNEFACKNGDVCALGAVAKKRGLGDLSGLEDDSEHEVGEVFGITPTLAWEIMYENDLGWKETPEQRYERVLKWINSKIKNGDSK